MQICIHLICALPSLPFLKQCKRHNNDSPLKKKQKKKENQRFPGIIKSWSAAPGLLRLCLKLREKMKNRSCIIIGAPYESAQVHLSQTPVWNAFWVRGCLALMSVILKSGRDRTLVDLSGRFMGCYRPPPPPTAVLLLHFVLTASDACCDFGDWRAINASTYFQVLAFWTVQRAGCEVSRPLRPAGSSLAGHLKADGVWSSVCQSGRTQKKREKSL